VKRLIVALHDVAPPFEREIEDQLRLLSGVGVDRVAFMVVPNWHGSHPIAQATSIVELLRERVKSGSEIVLHGLEHRARGPLSGSAGQKARARMFAPGVAEFLTLANEQAVETLKSGVEVLEGLGLPRPTGFCAPGWLLNDAGRSALAPAGIRYVINMHSVEEIGTAGRVRMPGFGYLGGSPAQETGIRILNRLVGTAGRGASILQIYLHPQGGVHNPDVQRLIRTIARLVARGDRQPATYADLWGSHEPRAVSHEP
jgi:uncharacterized protein